MRFILALALLLYLTGLTYLPAVSLASAQAETEEAEIPCLSPNFLLGSSVRVVGSVEADGLPIRRDLGLDNPVIGFIPLGTILIPGYEGCEAGRNWYSVRDVDVNGEIMSGYVVGDDGVHRWLEPEFLCQSSGIWLQMPDNTQYIADVYPGLDRLVISVGDSRLHPVLLDHFEVDLESGLMTPTEYPYADVVTRDLTDRLGITDRVFGEHSTSEFSLYVSPEGTKILYFLPSREGEDCVHYCYWVEGFVANADGSNPRSLGEIPTDTGLANVYWGTDGRIYLIHSEVTSGIVFTMGFCIEDSCTLDGSISEIAAEYGIKVTNGSLVTTSPNGRYLTINPIYYDIDAQDEAITGAYVIDLEDGAVIRLPDNGLSGVPVFWQDDTDLLYAVNAGDVLDTNGYAQLPHVLAHDTLMQIELDFTQGSYRFSDWYLGYIVQPPDQQETDIFDSSTQINWVNFGLKLFLAQGALRCVAGSRG